MRKSSRGTVALSALALLSLGTVVGASAAVAPEGFLVHAESDGGKYQATAGIKKAGAEEGGGGITVPEEPAAGVGVFSYQLDMAASSCNPALLPKFSGVKADTVLVSPTGTKFPMSSTGAASGMTPSTGKWTVQGSFAGFDANRSGCLTSVDRWTADTGTTSVSFSGTGSNLRSIAAPPATVTNLSYAFMNSTFDGDLSNWDLSHVTSINAMFMGSSFSGDLSKWNVSNVTDMGGVFLNSKFNGDVSNWDVSKVGNFQSMFANSSFDGKIASWKFGSVDTNSNRFDGMFNGSAFTGRNGGVNSWDVSAIRNFDGMFQGSPFSANLNDWNVSRANSMNNLFANSQFNGDISGWNPARLESANGMFQNAKLFNGNIGGWDMGYLMAAYDMFNGASSFTGNLSGWKPGRIYSEPSGFSEGSAMSALPTWS